MKNYKSLLIIPIILLSIGLGWYIKPNTNNTSSDGHNHQAESVSKDEIWTCSMDPQVRQNEPGDCPICGMDLIPAESMSSNDNPLVMEMTEDAIKLAQIQTTIVGESTQEGSTLFLNGRIQADETKAASLVSHIPGRIEKLYVSFTGEFVKKGQKIATIYAEDLISAQRELLIALELQKSSPNLLKAARNKLKFWKIPEATIQSIIDTRKVLEHFDIFADYSGVVTKRNVSVGDHTMTGTTLFEVQNLYNLWVFFDIYEKDLSKMSLNQQISFTTPGIPNQIFKSRITFIDPSINPQTRVGTVRTEIKNRGGKLKPEMFVKGKLKGHVSKNNVVTIPKSAVLWTGKRSVIYVKVPDTDIPSYEFREVELSEGTGSSYIVANGVELGEEVVTNGAFVIDASAQLNNQASMMNRNVKVKDAVEEKAVIPDFIAGTSARFKQQLEGALKAYLAMKDSFVETDASKTSIKAKDVLTKVEEIDVSLLTGEAHKYWMTQLMAIKSHGKKISTIKDIEDQRKQFNYVSQAMINAMKAYGVDSETFYVQFCPMAFDDEGAEWISGDDFIRNPYFGDKMMKCGIVRDSIK